MCLIDLPENRNQGFFKRIGGIKNQILKLGGMNVVVFTTVVYVRVHLRHRNRNFHEAVHLVVNGFRNGTDRNVFIVVHKFVGGRLIEVIVHRPSHETTFSPPRDTVPVRRRRQKGGFSERFHAPYQRRRSRALGIRILTDSSERFVCIYIKNDILH